MSTVSMQPFTIITDDETVTITIMPDVYDRPDLLAKAGCEWMRELKGHIEVDFVKIQQVNSTMVAWLFQLVQWGPGEVALTHASQRVRRQLKQFHLQHFVDFPMEDIDSSAVLPGTR